MATNVLIAEDERAVADVVAFGARMIWPECRVDVAANGEEALSLFKKQEPDLVVLDITMPPPDGFEVCREIRRVSTVPILMLTGRSSTLDKVHALDLGADDYLVKPFDHLELLARLRALDRRANVTARPGQIGAEDHISTPDLIIGEIALDTRTHQVLVRGEPVQFTSTEYRLLEELMRHAGSVMTHNLLIERVWGPEYVGGDHYLKVFVRRLRQKLGDDARHPRYIQNEWGVGYRFIAA
jgi:DNA-binding response OmpR family regulator